MSGSEDSTRNRPAVARAAGDTAALYLAQSASLLIPLILLPFITRVLPRQEWGTVAASQSMGLLVGIVVEFGFIYGGTRAVTIARRQSEHLARLVRSVHLIKASVSAALILAGVLISLVAGLAGEHLALVVLGIALGCAQGMSALWFFQGLEQVRKAAFIELGGKFVSLGLILILVRDPGDGWIYLACIGGLTMLANLVNFGRMRRIVGPTSGGHLGDAWRLFRSSIPLLAFRLLTSVNSLGGSAILQAMAGGAVAAGYANADRLSQAARSLIVPPSQVLYPKAVEASQRGPRDHERFLRKTTVGFFLIFFSGAMVAQLAVGWFVPWFFGEQYEDTIGIFRVLLLILPVVAVSNVLGALGLLAHGDVRRMNGVLIGTTAVFGLLVVILVPRHGAIGLAWANLGSEALLTVVLAGLSWKSLRGRD